MRRRRKKLANAVKDGRRNIRRLIAAAEKGDARAQALVEKHGLKEMEVQYANNMARRGTESDD